jgi:hypothetical protein
MTQPSNVIQCAAHGKQTKAFVCQHIVTTLDSRRAVGFHWSAEDLGPTPDAWCNACESARIAAGGEWTDKLLKKLGVTLICSSCYQSAKSIWQAAR